MSTCYVVMERVYDYGGSEGRPILATLFASNADAKVAEMQERHATALAAREMIAKQMEVWQESHPRPKITSPIQKPLPFFKGKKSHWTVEQRAGYKKVQEENLGAAAAAGEPFKQWANQRMAEEQRIKATLDSQLLEDFFLSKDTVWEVEEVPFM